MGEVRGNQAQLPADDIVRQRSAEELDAAVFARGVAAGREWARKSTQRALAWMEDHPGQALLVAVGAGFVLGKLLFRPEPKEED
jgi:ElaB/YqjD/DUF883 family membrane-anchored ribosome-binding protein